MNFYRVFIILIFLLQIIGCGKFTEFLDDVAPDTKKDYLKARTLPDLSIPPELTSTAIKDKMFIPDSSDNVSFDNFNERKEQTDYQPKIKEPQKYELGMIEERPVLLARIERDALWNRLRSFWESENKNIILDDSQLGIMETSWTESKDKLTRERYKIYTEEGKEKGLNIVFAICERQELDTQDTADGSDFTWGPSVRIVQEELNIMSRLRESLIGSSRYASLDKTNGTQMLTMVEPDPSDKKYTSGGSRFFKNRPYSQTESAKTNRPLSQTEITKSKPESRDVSIEEFKSQSQVAVPNNQVSLRAIADDLPQQETLQSANQNLERASSQVSGENRENIYINQNSLNPELVSVGRGNFYLTVENNYSMSWKLTERAIRRSGMAIRQADKARGVFVIDMSENNLQERKLFSMAKFWGGEKSSQFQVSLTGIGDKTEVVILDREGKWLTNQRSERLLDRLYNTLTSN